MTPTQKPTETTTSSCNQNAESSQSQGFFGQALDFALQATGTEKPKDPAGWAELLVRAKATVDRNAKNT